MDKTHVINNIFGVARRKNYVELVDGSPQDPIQLEVSDSMTLGAIYDLKGQLRDDDRLEDGIVDEIEVDVTSGEEVNTITFPNLTRGDYNGDRYKLGRESLSLTTEALEEEMMG